MLRDVLAWIGIADGPTVDDAALVKIVMRGLRVDPMATVIRGNQHRIETMPEQYEDNVAQYNAERENQQLGNFSDDDYDPEFSADDSYSVCSVYWLTFY
jgi:hypothetical protein